jgi:hypothetical protein
MGVNFAIGVSDFRALIQNQATYIDKTLLIKDLFEDLSGVILFPRPRRFGKTLNLSMLRYFLDLRDQNSGHLFDNLLVSKQPEIMAHQGKYPVIFISLKEIKKETYSQALDAFALLIQELFLTHKDLYKDLSPELQDRCHRLLNLNASEVELSKSLHLLSQILQKTYHQKVWILIDEYDTPIHEAWIRGYYERMKSFMQGFLGSALKDNTAVYKSILTGILRISKEGMFSDLNNLKVYSLLSERYGEYFGFTESEVDHICEIAGLSKQREAVRTWYNGYKFGELNIYNPWSIINFATEKKLQPYWVNTGSSAIIESLIAKTSDYFKSDFEVLVQGGTLTKPIDERIVLPEINANAEDAIWSFLVFSGYLKVIHQERTNQAPICQIQIPNEEILGIYQAYFSGWLKKNNPRQNEIMLEALVSGEPAIFEKLFTKYVEETLSYFDASGHEPERFYHALVLGILVTLRNSHQILSNRESGYGRYDVMIIPKDLSKLGIIIEFKVAESESDLETAATEALDQIQAKNYQAELEARGIKHILKLAIVFFGKKILIKRSG